MMRSRLVLLLSVLALFAAACGGGTDTGQTGDDETGPAETAMETETDPGEDDATETDTATEAMDGEATVAVASSDLGDILVDGEGMTLYLFLPDEEGTPTCTDACVDNWPPFEGPATAGEGADDSLLGTVDHPNGTTMATYNGWPLYHFTPDEQPGDTNGQGVGDKWYVVSPAGEPIQDSGGSANTGY